MEALWKVDLDCGSTATAGEGRCVSPYGGINNDEGSFLLPGDEPPSRNHTFTSPPSSSDRRWFLPPLNFNSTSDLAAGFSSFPVSSRSCFEYIDKCFRRQRIISVIIPV